MAEEKSETVEAQPDARKTRTQRFFDQTKGTLKCSFIFFSAIHLSKIIVAAIYYEKCPVEPDIPKYFLVLGILGMATKLITLFRGFLMKHTQVAPLLSIVTTAELAVLIVASYYIYSEFQPSYDPDGGELYCNKVLYLYAFIYVTILYSILLLVIIGVSCFILGLVILDKYTPPDENDPRKVDAIAEELQEEK